MQEVLESSSIAWPKKIGEVKTKELKSTSAHKRVSPIEFDRP